MDIYTKAAELILLTKKKKNIQEELGELDRSIDALEKELYWALISAKLYELETGGYVFKPVMKMSAAPKDEKTIRVLRRRGFGDIVKPTIHPSTASSFVRKQLEQGGGELPKWVTDIFSVVYKETLSMQKD